MVKYASMNSLEIIGLNFRTTIFEGARHPWRSTISRAQFLLCCLLSLAQPALAIQGESPLDTIQTSNARILEIYQTSPEVDQDVQQRIFTVMEEVTDFPAIAEQATDGFCESASTDSCKEFKQVFIELLKRNAIRKLGHYRADRFDYLGEEIDGEKAVIKTVAHFKEDSMHLDYLLAEKDKHWVIVNYIADEVDTIQNYRRQFSRILVKNTLADLIARLRKKSEEYQLQAQN